AMFTGIVTAIGRIAKVGGPSRDSGNGKPETGVTLTIRAPFKGLRRGESVAVNGACLTVERLVRGGFTVRAVTTTVDRTLLGEYAAGRRVNLERALRATDRLGGHLVQGHVDGVGTVVRMAPEADAVLVDLRVPGDVRAVSIPRGSITVDGVSLTVNGLPGPDRVQVALIPFTRAHTTLGALAVGDRVHVEGDVLAKYVGQLCRSQP
ncbi:MAG: riboflavin synthase, partial [Gemmatimonadales bacterium]